MEAAYQQEIAFSVKYEERFPAYKLLTIYTENTFLHFLFKTTTVNDHVPMTLY